MNVGIIYIISQCYYVINYVFLLLLLYIIVILKLNVHDNNKNFFLKRIV